MLSGWPAGKLAKKALQQIHANNIPSLCEHPQELAPRCVYEEHALQGLPSEKKVQPTRKPHLHIHDGLQDDWLGFVVGVPEGIQAGQLEGQLT